MLATLNILTKEKERLIEITVDGEITEDELPDFIKIRDELNQMARTIDSLTLWVNNAILSGKIDDDFMKKK